MPAGFGITPGGRPARWKRLFPMGNMAGHRPYTAVHRGLSMLDEQQAAYVDAQVLMEQGELEQARQAFLALEGYQDSEELAENIRIYLKALENDDIYKRYILLSNIEDFFRCFPVDAGMCAANI